MKDKKFGVGLVVGLVTGAAAGLLLNPKTGPENREAAAKMLKKWKDSWDKGQVDDRIKEMFGDATSHSREVYLDLRDRMMKKLSTVKDNLEKVDKEKYVELVKDVIGEWKEDKKIPNDQMEKVMKYLQKDYQKIMDEQKKEAKPSKKLIADEKKSVSKEK